MRKTIFYILLEKYHRYVFDTLMNQDYKCTWFDKKVLFKIHNWTLKFKFRPHLKVLTETYLKPEPKTLKDFIIKNYLIDRKYLRYDSGSYCL